MQKRADTEYASFRDEDTFRGAREQATLFGINAVFRGALR